MTLYYKTMFRLCLLLLFAIGGCTMHFKATDFEMDTETDVKFDLTDIDLLTCQK